MINTQFNEDPIKSISTT